MMKIRQSLLLLLTAAIWGVAFVAQSAGMDYVGPFTFNCLGSFLGGAVLLPVIFFLERRQEPSPGVSRKERGGGGRTLIVGGVCCGLALCLASNAQQIGIQYTTVGKAGFITACYIVIVPLLGLFFGKRVGVTLWGAVLLAVAGLFRLCFAKGAEGINRGDLIMMAAALLFSAHILVIDHFSPLADGVKLSCIQFFVAGILSGIAMVIFEEPRWDQIRAAAAPILYAGIFSSGVGYTLQIVGQKEMNPTVASLILSLESSISLIAGWILLGQGMTLRELSGCGLMFGAIILAQIPVPVRKKRE